MLRRRATIVGISRDRVKHAKRGAQCAVIVPKKVTGRNTSSIILIQSGRFPRPGAFVGASTASQPGIITRLIVARTLGQDYKRTTSSWLIPHALANSLWVLMATLYQRSLGIGPSRPFQKADFALHQELRRYRMIGLQRGRASQPTEAAGLSC
ncbi:hypothetical protein KM043_003415 [Ampulex compressa]|nr:hypothetical protein KM043_003415 [Ampulex compressa]